MRAYLENLTALPTRKMRSIVLWTLRELDIDRPDLAVCVREAKGVKHHGRFYAHAKTNWRGVWQRGNHRKAHPPDTATHLLMVHVPQEPWGRTDRAMRGGPPPIHPANWIESLICIVAHEGWHFREFLHPKKGKTHLRRTKRGLVTVGPKRHSEVDAEWAEYRLLKRWRER